MTRRRALVGLALLATLSACTGTPVAPAGPAAGQTGTSGTTVAPPGANRTTITGAVKLPSTMVAAGAMNLVAAGSMNLVAAGSMNLIAAGGMNLVAAGSMNMVAAGSMNLVAAGSMNQGGGPAGLVAAGSMNYDLLGIVNEPRGGVVVFLCDALGRPVPGLPPVSTDASGAYQIPNVPAGFTLSVNALVPYVDGSRGLLASLVHTGDAGGADIDAGTTVTSIRACSGRPNADLGDFDQARFRAASDATLEALTEGTTPDFRDLWKAASRAGQLEGEVKGLGDRLPPLREELATDPTSVDLLHRVVGAPAPSPVTVVLPPSSPKPTPEPTPVATPTPMKPDALLAGCGPAKVHEFVSKAKDGTRILFRVRRPGVENRLDWDIYTTAPITAEGKCVASVPEGCDFRVELVDTGGNIMAYNDRWAVPAGSVDPVPFPF